MAKKPGKHGKHIPQRTCVGCRQVQPKRALIRVVRNPEGIRVDPSGKAAGRGAYLHNLRSCWERGLKGGLAHALKTELSDLDRQELRNFMAGLPDETDEPVENQEAILSAGGPASENDRSTES